MSAVSTASGAGCALDVGLGQRRHASLERRGIVIPIERFVGDADATKREANSFFQHLPAIGAVALPTETR